MRFPKFSALLAAAALATTPSAVAMAEPAISAQTSAPVKPTAPASDAEQYAAREAKDVSVAKFQGGAETTYVVFGASGIAIVLLVVILVILL